MPSWYRTAAYSLALGLLVSGGNAQAFSPKCLVSSKCVKTQNTSIPSDQVFDMLDRCREFTNGAWGRQALRLSIQQINQQSAGNHMHPLFTAYYAFTQLYDSPLVFTRQASVENTRYEQIAQSCAALNRDLDRYLAE